VRAYSADGAGEATAKFASTQQQHSSVLLFEGEKKENLRTQRWINSFVNGMQSPIQCKWPTMSLGNSLLELHH
jgi:hypothetical protein